MTKKFNLSFTTLNSGKVVLTGRVLKDGTVKLNQGLNTPANPCTVADLQTVARVLNGSLVFID